MQQALSANSTFAIQHGLYWLLNNLTDEGPVALAVDDVHWSGGVGVHFITPIGPLRLDYAYRFAADESDLLAGRALERDGLHSAIGFMF